MSLLGLNSMAMVRHLIGSCRRHQILLSYGPVARKLHCFGPNTKDGKHCYSTGCHYDSSDYQLVELIKDQRDDLEGNRSQAWMSQGANTSLVSNEEIRHRQRRLMELLCVGENQRLILVVPAAPQTNMAGTEIPNYNLKQSSDFIYLTGLNLIKSLDSVLVIVGGKQEPTKSVLFANFHDARKNVWLGPDLTNQTRRPIDGLFDEVKSSDQLGQFIEHYTGQGYRQGGTKLFLKQLANKHTHHLARVIQSDIYPNHGSHQGETCDITKQLDKMKFIKSTSEIEAMRRACYIGSKSMLETIKWAQNSLPRSLGTRAELNEGHLVGRYEYETRLRGSTKLTFWPVCAGQDRATTIHYGTNDQDINVGDWILMDAGCEEFDGYNSDITRTFPISPKQSSSRKSFKLRYELFEALEDVHNRLVKIAANDRPSLDELYRHMLRLISELLYEFKPFNQTMTISEYSSLATKYCPHHVSHYLGLDLHDTPTMSRSVKLEQGVCFTIEPGLYFPITDDNLKDEFKGIGYRIEDDCIVNEHDRLEVLTRHIDHDLSFDDTLK